jgi:hypothetical protein
MSLINGTLDELPDDTLAQMYVIGEQFNCRDFGSTSIFSIKQIPNVYCDNNDNDHKRVVYYM